MWFLCCLVCICCFERRHLSRPVVLSGVSHLLFIIWRRQPGDGDGGSGQRQSRRGAGGARGREVVYARILGWSAGRAVGLMRRWSACLVENVDRPVPTRGSSVVGADARAPACSVTALGGRRQSRIHQRRQQEHIWCALSRHEKMSNRHEFCFKKSIMMQASCTIRSSVRASSLPSTPSAAKRDMMRVENFANFSCPSPQQVLHC